MKHASISTYLAAALLAAPLSPLFAQAENDPIGRNNPAVKPLAQVAVHTVPALNHAAIAAEDAQRDGPGVPPRYAMPNRVDLTPWNAGTWENVDATRALWRLRVRCPGAAHVNLGFKWFKLPPDSQMIVHSADYSHIVRPFTGKDHNADGQLYTPIVFGDEVVIEVLVPIAQQPKLQMHLTYVGSGYRFFGVQQQFQLGGSGSCNVNVACPEGDAWRPEISSVAAYSTAIGIGNVFCSGAMVNNTAEDGRFFFLTAAHCGIDAGNASSLVCYWNYEEINCTASGTGPTNQFTTGSTWRAEYGPSDVTLVELTSGPDPAWNISFAGWDRSGSNATSAVAIHHPSGDEKKISFENQSTTTTSYYGTSIPGNGTHVRVIDWDLGTTEGGSSGSPLFDQNQRVIGQLHGGDAACGNNLSDWYGRFSVSWTGGGTNSSRLSNWLDPLGTGQTTTDTFGGSAPMPPVNDDCANALTIFNGTNGSYSSANATNSSPAWSCASGGADVWFSYTAPCTGTATFETCSAATTFDTAIQAFSGTCGSLTSLGCNDDTCGLQSSVTINVTIGQTYLIRVGGYQGATGIFEVDVSCSGPTGPLNDECSGATVVTDGTNGPFSSATATTSAPAWTCGNGGNDVWFAYTATCNGTASVTTCSPTRTFDTVLAAYAGSCGSPTLLLCNDDDCDVRGSTVDFATTLGTTYWLRVGGYNGASGNFDVTITCTSAGGTATATPYGIGCYDRARSFYEDVADGSFDLNGQRLYLTPNAEGGYDVTRGSTFWNAPTSPDLGLDDDDVVTQTLPFTLDFPGGSTTQIGICSNGYIWLDGTSTDADYEPSLTDFSTEAARLCPVWTDYNPLAGGSVHYDVVGGVVYVTWLGVPEFGETNASSFQVCIAPDDSIEFRYLTAHNVNTARDTIVGFSSGGGARLPAATDLSTLGQISTAGPDSTPLSMVATTRPVLGTNQTMTISGIPGGSVSGAVMYGFAQYLPGLDLTLIGIEGCNLHTSSEFTFPFGGGPTEQTNWPVPNDSGLMGLNLFAQAASISPGQNTLGILTSNGVALVVDVF